MGYYLVTYWYKSERFGRLIQSRDEYDSLEESLSRFLWLQHCGFEPVLRFCKMLDEDETENCPSDCEES